MYDGTLGCIQVTIVVLEKEYRHILSVCL